jgi:hypothetical protein
MKLITLIKRLQAEVRGCQQEAKFQCQHSQDERSDVVDVGVVASQDGDVIIYGTVKNMPKRRAELEEAQRQEKRA